MLLHIVTFGCISLCCGKAFNPYFDGVVDSLIPPWLANKATTITYPSRTWICFVFHTH